jgi:hypothetical protein
MTIEDMANMLNQQLNNLRNEIKPDAAWQARSRDILLMQIKQGAAEKDAHWFSFFESVWMQKFMIQATRPMALAMIIVLAVFGGSAMSLRAANQTKPGDPLYIAKIISEKTQFALTFDNTKKAKLNLTFAANRATELKELEQNKSGKPEHDAQVLELTSEINTELAEAKTRIANMDSKAPVKTEKADESPKQSDSKDKPEAKKPEPAQVAKTDAKTVNVAPAVIEKDKEGLDYFDPRQAALEKAKNYIESKDYNAAADQLITLTAAIDEPEKLNVKSEATTTKTKDIKVETLDKSSSTVDK